MNFALGMQMRGFGFGVAAILLCILSACAGPVRRISDGAEQGKAVYPVEAKQAEDVILRSMLAVFPDVPVERASIPEPYIRYQSSLRVAFDHHVIVATAAPTDGVGADGRVVRGYVFEVSDNGSLLIRGPARAQAVTEEIKNRLAALSSPLAAKALQ